MAFRLPKLQSVTSTLIPYIGMFLLALLMWLPFSFKTTGLMEELRITALLDSGNPLFFITAETAMATQRGRPLEQFFHSLAYTLDPNSFFYYNVFQMLFIFSKLVVTYWLVLEFLPKKRVLAFLIGVLFILYPADTGLFTFRTMTIYGTLLAYLLGVLCLIRYWKGSGRRGWLLPVAAGGCVALSLLQYPIALPLALTTPLSGLYFLRPNRRFWTGTLLWVAGIATAILYSVWAIGQSSQASYDDAFAQTLTRLDFGAMLRALALGYERQVTGWLDILGKWEYLTFFWPYVLAGLALFVGVAWWLIRCERREDAAEVLGWKRALGVIVVGVAIIALGMAAYLPIPSHRSTNFRIYFISIMGSSMLVGMGLYFIAGMWKGRRDTVMAITATPLVGMMLLGGFEQHQMYVNYSLQQQEVLQQIVSQAPQVKPNTSIFVVSSTDLLDHEYMFQHGTLLESALRYLYGTQAISARVCFIAEDSKDSGCEFASDVLRYRTPAYYTNVTVSQYVPYGQLLLFRLKDDDQLQLMSTEQAEQEFHIEGYQPENRIPGSSLPKRYYTLFSCIPAMSCYRVLPSQPSDTIDLPGNASIGLGWREPEFNEAGNPFWWSIRRLSTVNVNLSDASDLKVEFEVYYWLDDAVINSLTLSVNGVNIPLTYAVETPLGRRYSGIIPRSALLGQPSKTKLVFQVADLAPVPDVQAVRLGFRLSWVRIRPIADSS